MSVLTFIREPAARAHLDAVLPKHVVRSARAYARSYIGISEPDSNDRLQLAWHALRLARVDVLVRAPLLKETALDRLVHSSCPYLNPSFGEWSVAIGGADADLVSGERLIDLETTSQASVSREDVRQIATYFLLARLARDEGVELPPLDSIASTAFASTERWFRNVLKERAAARRARTEKLLALLGRAK